MPVFVSAQNLIANGGFETRNICTEYEADCAPEAWFKIPPDIIPLDKVKGAPANSGEFADNIVLENKIRPFSYRVFIYTMLLCPLEKDTAYLLELSVNPLHEMNYELGVLFSVEELVPGFVNPLTFVPSLMIADSGRMSLAERKNWRKLQANYTAKGGEQFLTIGNFSKTAFPFSKKTKVSNKMGDVQILIDDISVTPVHSNAGAVCPQYESNLKLLYATDERHSYKKGVTRREKSELFEEPSTADPDVPLLPSIKNDPLQKAPPEKIPPKEPAPKAKFVLPDVAFDFDKYDIKPAFFAPLDLFIQQVKIISPQEIIITGHTDDVGSNAYNLDISAKRADAVKSYVLREYPDYRGAITAVGKGEAEPKTNNLTEANRARNRRVEIIVR